MAREADIRYEPKLPDEQRLKYPYINLAYLTKSPEGKITLDKILKHYGTPSRS